MDIKSHRLKINYIFVNKNEQKSTLDGQNITLQIYGDTDFHFLLNLNPIDDG